MNPHTNVIQEAASILNVAKQQIKQVLESENDLKQLSETIFNQLSTVEKRFYALSGLPEKELEQNAFEFKPLTKIMGIAVDGRKPVSQEDLKPTLSEKEKLIERIKSFYDTIPKMSNEKILEIVREPKGEAILRGVAKIAKIEDWKESPLTIFFVDEIKAGIALFNEMDAAITASELEADSIEMNSVVERPWAKPLPESSNPNPAPLDTALPESDATQQLNPISEIVKSDYKKDQETKANELDPATEENTGTDIESLVIEAKRLKDEGMTIKEIAEKLGKSTGTISNYINKK